MQTLTCPLCTHENEVALRPRLFANPVKEPSPRDPKFFFHVKALCAECEHYIKFVTQDEDVIAELNGQTSLV